MIKKLYEEYKTSMEVQENLRKEIVSKNYQDVLCNGANRSTFSKEMKEYDQKWRDTIRNTYNLRKEICEKLDYNVCRVSENSFLVVNSYEDSYEPENYFLEERLEMIDL